MGRGNIGHVDLLRIRDGLGSRICSNCWSRLEKMIEETDNLHGNRRLLSKEEDDWAESIKGYAYTTRGPNCVGCGEGLPRNKYSSF